MGIRCISETLRVYCEFRDLSGVFGEKTVKRLVKIKLSYFKGQANPTFLKSWVREFEKILGVVNCPEGVKVGQTVLYLKMRLTYDGKRMGLDLMMLKGLIGIPLFLL